MLHEDDRGPECRTFVIFAHMAAHHSDTEVMADWEFDFHWLRVRHWIAERLGQSTPPDMKTTLFILGLQEMGRWSSEVSKEEKQDLMHVATCVLLSRDGYYRFTGMDHDGWPHFDLAKKLPFATVEEQEKFLKLKIIEYVDEKISGDEEE